MLYAIYFFFLAVGFKSTWGFVVNNILAGAGSIGIAVFLFVVMILVLGPVMGVVHSVKYVAARVRKPD